MRVANFFICHDIGWLMRVGAIDPIRKKGEFGAEYDRLCPDSGVVWCRACFGECTNGL